VALKAIYKDASHQSDEQTGMYRDYPTEIVREIVFS